MLWFRALDSHNGRKPRYAGDFRPIHECGNGLARATATDDAASCPQDRLPHLLLGAPIRTTAKNAQGLRTPLLLFPRIRAEKQTRRGAKSQAVSSLRCRGEGLAVRDRVPKIRVARAQ